MKNKIAVDKALRRVWGFKRKRENRWAWFSKGRDRFLTGLCQPCTQFYALVGGDFTWGSGLLCEFQELQLLVPRSVLYNQVNWNIEKLHVFGVVIGPKSCLKQDNSEFAIDFKAEIAYCHLVWNESLCTELRDVVFMHQETFSEGLVIANCCQLGWDYLVFCGL